MVKRKHAQSGKKAGSIISDPIDPPTNKNKKKAKKQSRGKQKH